MPKVHGTAILEGEIELADDVEIGPGCILTGPIRIGAGTRMMARATLQGPLVIGEGNLIWPGVCLGMAPQSARFDPFEPGPGVVVGDHNSFREQVTIHRATHATDPTRIGNRNYFMVGSHAGHDVVVGNGCTFANGSLLGGHAVIEDGAITGGNSAVHQFVRVGAGSMISGGTAISLDLMPHFMVTATNFAGSLNLVGLRRKGATLAEIEAVRWVYKTICRDGLGLRAATDRLRQRADDPTIARYLEFISKSKRGLVTRHGREGSDRARSADMAV
jgi:UDP-N-acetylglucosamine acyltransferase